MVNLKIHREKFSGEGAVGHGDFTLRYLGNVEILKCVTPGFLSYLSKLCTLYSIRNTNYLPSRIFYFPHKMYHWLCFVLSIASRCAVLNLNHGFLSNGTQIIHTISNLNNGHFTLTYYNISGHTRYYERSC